VRVKAHLRRDNSPSHPYIRVSSKIDATLREIRKVCAYVKDGTLLAIRVKSRYRFSIGLEKLEEGKTKRERERERERERKRERSKFNPL